MQRPPGSERSLCIGCGCTTLDWQSLSVDCTTVCTFQSTPLSFVAVLLAVVLVAVVVLAAVVLAAVVLAPMLVALVLRHVWRVCELESDPAESRTPPPSADTGRGQGTRPGSDHVK